MIFQKYFLLLALIGLSACSSTRVLAPTPNLFANDSFPQEEVAPALRTTQPSVFYVTDRIPDLETGELYYSSERSNSMAFGASKVDFGNESEWQDLATASGTVNRSAKLPLSIVENREIIRFDSTPLPFTVKNGRPVRLPKAVQSYNKRRADFQAHIKEQMRTTGTDEVVVFVHGFNNSFDDAVFAAADIWHFSGRRGIPIAYSWPAGAGGLFGYLRDRESGEFTVFHLKEFLRHLSDIPELRKIHIVAHSRGTDVTTTALRELIIAARNQGRNPKDVLKIENLVLAAPDLDFSIVRQRLVAEGFGAAIGQITVYINRGDTALGLAQRLMAGQRFGKLSVSDINPAEKAIFSEVKTVNFVDVQGVRGLSGHAYYRTNRNVLSDIAVLIRESATPGSSARPLTHIEGNFWTMPQEYPF